MNLSFVAIPKINAVSRMDNLMNVLSEPMKSGAISVTEDSRQIKVCGKNFEYYFEYYFYLHLRYYY